MAKILIVDDSPTEVHVIQTILQKNGHEVVVAVTGEEGVITAKDEMPDLVLMDVVMPGINGFQATRQLSKQTETANIPVTPHCANMSLVTLFTMHLLRAIPNAGKYLEFSIQALDGGPAV